jgi:hypothetical protein
MPRPASSQTLRLCAADWAAFENWCGKQSLVSLPAGATSVAAFLSEGAATLSAGALMRRAAAIAAKHRQNGLISPAADPMVAAILRLARQAATPRPGACPNAGDADPHGSPLPPRSRRDARPHTAAAGRLWPRSYCAGWPRQSRISGSPQQRSSFPSAQTERVREHARKRAGGATSSDCQSRGLGGCLGRR